MNDRAERLLACAVILLGWGVRLFWLVESPIWYDESFTLFHAQEGPWHAMLTLGRMDNALPLYGMLLSLWVWLFGSQEFVVRFFSALVGMTALPLVGRWGGEVTGRRIEWGPMLFVATCPIFVRYGYEVRMYALGISLAAAFGWLSWRLLTGRQERLWPYLLVGVAMLLSHGYTGFLWAALLVIGGFAWLAGRLAKPGLWWRANLTLGMCAIPIAAWMFWRSQQDATAFGPLGLNLHLPTWLPHQFGLSPFLARPWDWVAVAALLVSVSLGAARLWRARGWRALAFLAVGLTLPVALLKLAGQLVGKWGPQYLIFSWGMALALGVGLAWRMAVSRRRPGLISVIGPTLALLWTILAVPAVRSMSRGDQLMLRDEFNPRPDLRAVARYIEANEDAGDAILVISGIAAHTLDYHYAGESPVLGLPDAVVMDTRRAVELRHLRQVEERLGSAQRLWLVLWLDEFADPNSQVLDTLVERCAPVPVTREFLNAGLLLFDLEACRPLDALVAAPPQRLNLTFGAIELLGYRLSIESGQVALSLWWEIREPTGIDWSTFVHLERDGELIGQEDQLLGTDQFPTSLWEPGTKIKTRHRIALPPVDCVGCVLYVGVYDRREMLRSGGFGRVLLPDGRDRTELALPADILTVQPVPRYDSFGPLRLIGYRAARDSQYVSLTLWWRGDTPIAADYSAFVHLFRGQDKIGQEDRILGGGVRTSQWSPGTVARTRHRIALPADGCPDCSLLIGLYDAQKIALEGGDGRLMLPGGGTHISLPVP